MTIPSKEYNAEKGVMEDTNTPEWQEYYRKLDEFREMMFAKKPNPQDFRWTSHSGWPDVLCLTLYEQAVKEWERSYSMDRPNKPGYIRAAND